ncbi:MAG: DUF192 domain-containing protein [Gammaproteobacteria bacterium]
MSTDNHQNVVTRVYRAQTTFERMRGLLARPPLNAEEGFWLEPCNSVHTFGMRYSLDVVFMEAGGRIVKLVENLRPWRIAGSIGARSSLELRIGTIKGVGLNEGQRLQWREIT